MVVIKQQLVTSRAKTSSGTNGRKYITIHETANTSRGANAQAHANLQTNGFSASWHYTVDDKLAIQSFPHNVRCWHSGDGTGSGNFGSIGIEICVNSDGDFGKAVDNAAELVRKIMADEGIPIDNVVQHNRWSGKNCPTNLRNGSKGVNWVDFLRKVGSSQVDQASKPVVKPKPSAPAKPKPAPSTPAKPKTATSIVDWLNANKRDSSIGARKKLAVAHGIKGYSGTAAQNTALLKAVQGGVSKPVSNPNPAVKPADKPTSTRALRFGDSGAEVREMQRLLAKAFFYPEKGAKNKGVDGHFGRKTEDALKRFQSVHTPKEVDGYYGVNTKAALSKL